MVIDEVKGAGGVDDGVTVGEVFAEVTGGMEDAVFGGAEVTGGMEDAVFGGAEVAGEMEDAVFGGAEVTGEMEDAVFGGAEVAEGRGAFSSLLMASCNWGVGNGTRVWMIHPDHHKS